MSEIKSVVVFSEWYCRSKGAASAADVQKHQDLGSEIPVSLAHYSHPSQSVASIPGAIHFSGLRNTPASATPALANYEKEFGSYTIPSHFCSLFFCLRERNKNRYSTF